MNELIASDGARLHLQEWPAGTAPPRGRVLVVHGLGEHIGRYAPVAEFLNARGWAVAGYDQRGHGQSAGARGAIPEAFSLAADLAQVIDAVRLPGLPLVLLGHSMGGLLAARFVAEELEAQPAAWQRPVDALMLSSPALDPGMSAFQKGLLALLGGLAPNLAVGNGLRPAWLSRDPAVVADYIADPLNHDRVTPRLVRFIVDGGALAVSKAPQWRTPTLLLWAGADRCVAPRGSAAFAAAALRETVEAHEFPPLFHEIFNEPERAEVLARLADWLDRRFPPR